jgi:putative transposase
VPLEAQVAEPRDIRHLDEVVISIKGEKRYLWRAVDQEGYVLDETVQFHRDTKAARRLLIPAPAGIDSLAFPESPNFDSMR